MSKPIIEKNMSGLLSLCNAEGGAEPGFYPAVVVSAALGGIGPGPTIT